MAYAPPRVSRRAAQVRRRRLALAVAGVVLAIVVIVAATSGGGSPAAAAAGGRPSAQAGDPFAYVSSRQARLRGSRGRRQRARAVHQEPRRRAGDGRPGGGAEAADQRRDGRHRRGPEHARGARVRRERGPQQRDRRQRRRRRRGTRLRSSPRPASRCWGCTSTWPRSRKLTAADHPRRGQRPGSAGWPGCSASRAPVDDRFDPR